MTLEHADGSQDEIDGNRMYTLKQGDTMTIISSGGGGFGNPRQRNPEAVLRDVRNGLVSMAAAREKYAVAIRHDGTTLGYSIVQDETAQLRAA